MDLRTSLPPPDPEYFLVTPYKCVLSVVINSYLRMQATMSKKEKASFARFIINHIMIPIEGSFNHFVKSLDHFKLTEVKQAMEAKLSSIKVQGMGSLLDLVVEMKGQMDKSGIHRSSLVGLFVRKMEVFVDKMSFTALDMLFAKLKTYISSHHQQDIKKSSAGDFTSPKQMSSLLSEQVKLLHVNERLAMGPKKLHSFISSVRDELTSHSRMQLSLLHQQQLLTNPTSKCSNSNLPSTITSGNNNNSNNYNRHSFGSRLDSHLEFARFLNYIRVKDIHGAKESLVSYHDSSNSSACWSVYNLARLNYLLGHDSSRCLDAIKECISFSQTAGDEQCLQFVLLLLSKVLLRRQPLEESDFEDIVSLLLHLTSKDLSDHQLPALSAISGLHLEQLLLPFGRSVHPTTTSSTTRNPGNLNAEVLAVKTSLNDILAMVYSTRAAHFAWTGEPGLSNLTSQALLNLDLVYPVGGVIVRVVDDNTSIAVTNIARFLSKIQGDVEGARQILTQVCSNLFSFCSDSNNVWRQALYEMDFDSAIKQNKWKEARIALDQLAVFDEEEYQLNTALFLMKKRNLREANQVLNRLESSTSSASNNNNMNNNRLLRLRVMMTRAELLQDISLAEKCVEFASLNNLFGWWARCQLLLASLLTKDAMNRSRAFEVLRRVTVSVLSTGWLEDVARLSYLYAVNLSASGEDVDLVTSSLESAISYNQRSIDIYSRIRDIDNWKQSLVLQAHLHNRIGNHELRNYFARQVRRLT